MKFCIKDEIAGRIRVHLDRKKLDCGQADFLQRFLEEIPGVYRVKVYERTADAAISYREDRKRNIREGLLLSLRHFKFPLESDIEGVERIQSGRAMNKAYKERLIQKILMWLGCRAFLPRPLCALRIGLKSLSFLRKGLCSLKKGRLEVEVLDAAAITASILRGDYATAGSVMMLLEIGEILEEWTHKKSVDDLARTMAIHVDKVWMLSEEKEVLVPCDRIH